MLLFKYKLPQSTSSFMLQQITNRNKDTKFAEQINTSKPKMFHEAFFKTVIDQGGFTWVNQKLTTT